MLTVGVDLAAEPVNTAVARVRWAGGGAQVQALTVGADDVMLVAEIGAADKAGIDCPLGWPRRFVEFVAQHQAGQFVAPVNVAGKDWRRRLALRETDRVTRDLTGLVPLSVAADRIGLAAMRCAGLLAHLAAAGQPVDRAGASTVVEVYPAAALKHWGLTHRGYKGPANAAVRHELVDSLTAKAPWLRLGVFEQACRSSDHALDAVIAALNARRRPRIHHHTTRRTRRRRPLRRLDRATHHQPHRPHRRTPALTRSAAPASPCGRPLHGTPGTALACARSIEQVAGSSRVVGSSRPESAGSPRGRRSVAISDGALRPIAVLHRCSVAMHQNGTGWHQATRWLGVNLQG